MGVALLSLAIVAACAWLGLSAYLGAVETEAAFLHAEYRKCPLCHHHYFADTAHPQAHECRSHSYRARVRHALARPAQLVARHAHGTH